MYKGDTPWLWHEMLLEKQFIRFLIVGLLNTMFSYAIYAICIWFGLAYYEASLIGLIIGILFSFRTQGRLVFRNSDNRLIFLFSINWVVIYACMVGVISALVRLGLNDYWAGLLALPLVAGLSYLTQKNIVFKKSGLGRFVNPSIDQVAESRVPLTFYIKNYRHFLRRLLVRNGYGRIHYGSHTYGLPQVRWWGEEANLIIGKFCSIGKDVEILLGGNHRSSWVSMYPFPAFGDWRCHVPTNNHTSTRGDVTIGNDVWLGQGSVILSGVRIGNGAVVGAYAVVSKDIPDYSIAVGNPAKVVRKRFSDEQIAQLNVIAWWNWDFVKIQANIPKLLSYDIQDFIRHHEAEAPCVDEQAKLRPISIGGHNGENE